MNLNDRRKLRTSPLLYRRVVAVNAFRLFWLAALIYGEFVVFWSSSSCKWPGSSLSFPNTVDRTHVLLISDPQVQEPSIPWSEASLIGVLKRVVFRSNLRKSWHTTQKLNPDYVIFLGDMLSSGKYAHVESYFEQYWQEFRRIFPVDSKNAYYLPGNNDVGMGMSSYALASVRQFYRKRFGSFNQIVNVRNHTFVLLDAPGLVDEDYQRSAASTDYDNWEPLRSGPVEFVKSVPQDDKIILLSHIPLSRPDRASCGPLRERGTITKGVGHGGYQNELGKQTTAFLLHSLRPAHIFSGDNRDYCDYTHSYVPSEGEPVARVQEVTVKSFSLARNIRKPGFQLLTIVNPPLKPAPSRTTLYHVPCHLPDQYGIYSSFYLPLVMLTLIAIFLINVMRSQNLRSGSSIAPIATSRSLGEMHITPPGTPTPHLHPNSQAWSPYTPPRPVSPLGTLPSKLRTPNTGTVGPSLRAASRPPTPQGSPLLAPVTYIGEEEDDETIYPAQYALQQRHAHLYDNDWTPGHEPQGFNLHHSREDSEPRPSPMFLPAPGSKNTEKRSWSKSWTFVFRGRRRRMTIRLPKVIGMVFPEMKTLFLIKDTDASFMKRGVVVSTLIDGLTVLWPVSLCWIVMLWWTS